MLGQHKWLARSVRLSLHMNNWLIDKNFYLVIRNNIFLLSTVSCSWILAPKVTCLLKMSFICFRLLFCVDFSTCRKGFCVRNRLVCLRISAWNSTHHNNLECKTAGWCTASKQVRISPSGKRTFFFKCKALPPLKFLLYVAKKLSLLKLVSRKITLMDSSKVRDHMCLLEKYIFTSDFS